MSLKNLENRALNRKTTNSGLVARRVKLIKATVSELREAIERNPESPVAGKWFESLYDMADSDQVFVEAPDVLSLLRGTPIITQTDLVNGIAVTTKTSDISFTPTPVLEEESSEST